MKKKELALLAIEKLKERYPEGICSLTYTDPLQLLIATRLSAQCTDARVNMVTPALFARFPTLEAFAEASAEEVGEYIRSCGLYKTKARDIVALAIMLRDEYDGVIPDTVEELIKLPGVGRKTANLVAGDIYGRPAVVADTHCIRIAGRLGGFQGSLQGGDGAEKAAASRGKQQLLSSPCSVWPGRVLGPFAPLRRLPLAGRLSLQGQPCSFAGRRRIRPVSSQEKKKRYSGIATMLSSPHSTEYSRHTWPIILSGNPL